MDRLPSRGVESTVLAAANTPDLIYHTLNELLEGRMPDTAHSARFGA